MAQPQSNRHETDRLLLRSIDLSDAASIQSLADDPEIARNTLTYPHPFPAGEGVRWVLRSRWFEETGKSKRFAIVRKEDGEMAGVVGLELEPKHCRAEMGYWIGAAYRKKGYAVEACRVALHVGFEQLNLHRIYAHVFLHNSASRGVLAKIGMRVEGIARGAIKKGDTFLDCELWSRLATDPEPP